VSAHVIRRSTDYRYILICVHYIRLCTLSITKLNLNDIYPKTCSMCKLWISQKCSIAAFKQAERVVNSLPKSYVNLLPFLKTLYLDPVSSFSAK